ncbi:MAG: MFS transporter [Candidatus Hydrothermarchaeota archaeon]
MKKGLLLLLLWLSYIVNYANRLSISPALPAVSLDLGLSNTEAGLIMSLFFVSYTLMQLPAGVIADRFNPLKVLGLGCMAYSLLGGSFALVRSATQAYVSRSLFGLAQAFGWVPSVAAIYRLFPGAGMGRTVGLFTSALALGPFVGGVLASMILKQRSWHYAFYIPALVGVAFSLLFLYLTRDVKLEEVREGSTADGCRMVFKEKNIWFLSGAYFSLIYVYWGALSWMPSLLYHQGFELEAAAFFGLSWTLPGLISQPLGGSIADRLGRRKPYLIAGALISQAAVFAALALGSRPLPLIFLLGFLVLLPFAAIFTLPVEILSPKVAGTCAGFLNTVSHLGAILAPIVFGLALDLTGDFTMALFSFIPVCILGGVSAAMIRLE